MICFQLVSKETAKSRGLKCYFNGSTCSRGNVWLRRTSTGNCVCTGCLNVKNNGNKAYYESVKNDPGFIARVRADTEKRKGWKREYDREYRRSNLDKCREWSRQWVLRNKEKRQAISSNYKAKRRAKEKSGLSSKELSEWKGSQPKTCYWCKSLCHDDYHVDHYHPLSKGGRHEIDNLVIACSSCNLRKSAKDPYEFAKEVGRLF